MHKTWLRHRWWIDGRLVRLSHVEDSSIINRNGIPIQVRKYQSAYPNQKVLFYLHGGGWVGRNIDTYDNFCRRLALHTNMTVYSIGYRLSPETKFPGAIEDGIDVIRQMVARDRLNPEKLYISGDSAGGNMAIGITYLLRQEIRFQKLLLLYPPLSAYLNQSSMETNGNGYIIEKDNIIWMRDQYLNTKSQFNDPLISPVFHTDFSFLPETMVIVGGKDPLLDQANEFNQKVRNAAKTITIREYPGLPHGFFILYNLSKSIKEAYRDVYRFLEI